MQALGFASPNPCRLSHHMGQVPFGGGEFQPIERLGPGRVLQCGASSVIVVREECPLAGEELGDAKALGESGAIAGLGADHELALGELAREIVVDRGRPVLAEGAARSLQRLRGAAGIPDRKSTRLNSSHVRISYAVFCLKKKKMTPTALNPT